MAKSSKRATQQRRTVDVKAKNPLDDSRVKITRTSLKNLDQKTRERFGRHLHRLMKNRGMAQGELADKAFGRDADNKVIGRDRISKYLMGKTFPENESLALLAKGLEIEIIELVTPDIIQAIETINTTPMILEVYPNGMCQVSISGLIKHKTALKLIAVLSEDQDD